MTITADLNHRGKEIFENLSPAILNGHGNDGLSRRMMQSGGLVLGTEPQQVGVKSIIAQPQDVHYAELLNP